MGLHAAGRRHSSPAVAELLRIAVFFGAVYGGAVQLLGQLFVARLSDALAGPGEAFATNIGGRMIGTFAAVITAQAAGLMPDATASSKLACSAGVPPRPFWIQI